MHLSCFPLLFTILHLTSALSPTRLIYQFPLGTWLENLAVRPCGSILLSTVTAPEIYLINPLAPNPQPTLVHNFTEASWTVGITETIPDTFYVAAANGSLTELPPAPGSNRLFRVRFPYFGAATPQVELAATVGDAVFLNGLTTLDARTVLAADCVKGAIWAINVIDGSSKIVIQDPLMAPNAANPIGVNGLRILNGQLYFTNSAQSLFAKIAIKPDGTPRGPPATVIASTAADDFALDWRGDAFIATAGGNTIVEVKKNGKQAIIAGDLNSTEIAEPTSARFGRTWQDRGTLYVTTAGGLGVPIKGDERVGGQLVAVDVRND